MEPNLYDLMNYLLFNPGVVNKGFLDSVNSVKDQLLRLPDDPKSLCKHINEPLLIRFSDLQIARQGHSLDHIHIVPRIRIELVEQNELVHNRVGVLADLDHDLS